MHRNTGILLLCLASLLNSFSIRLTHSSTRDFRLKGSTEPDCSQVYTLKTIKQAKKTKPQNKFIHSDATGDQMTIMLSNIVLNFYFFLYSAVKCAPVISLALYVVV